ncbi:MAG: transketolase, partial [SAR202 cluster bacterium]|nr:transketolase [SAR202 cluster bacterium]
LDRGGQGGALGGAEGLHRGAYVLWESGPSPKLLLIATGSEVPLALDAGRKLAEGGVAVRVVSMPCWELFEAQTQAYRDSVLPPAITARLAVEAASPLGWSRWVGSAGDTVSVTTFGHSAPGNVLMEKYGFTVDNVAARAKHVLERAR